MSNLRTLLAALLCLGVVPACAADLDLIQNASHRQGVSLNGPWQTIVDPYESGYLDYRYRPYADGGFGANKKPKAKSDLIEYDFDCVKQPGHRIFVWFGAANYRAMVFLNGAKIGEHAGGFTPFQFEITDQVRDRANVLIVKVDDQRKQEFIPTVMTDW